MSQMLAPPPASVGRRRVVAPRVGRIDAELHFDAGARQAWGRAAVEFRGGVSSGYPALDLRQQVTSVSLDGRPLDTDAWAPADLGGGPGAEMRVLDVEIGPDEAHRLEVEYTVGAPTALNAEGPLWVDGGVRFDTGMSDLAPGRYLESWVPAPLIHDRFTLCLKVAVEGTDRPHSLIANTAGVDAESGGGGWTLVFPAHFTALSPLVHVAPADSLEIRRSSVALPGRSRSLGLVTARPRDLDVDLGVCEADISAWLIYCAARYQPWAHGDTFWAVVWDDPRGMEYDGATTSSTGALEHEVFHSWFGRGVKPARASDGWIDEAWTTWATATRRSQPPRFSCEELTLDEDPVILYPPHPWARYTTREAYSAGARLFAGLAYRLGGADRLRAAMADWYRANAGALVTTDGLAAHLSTWSGVDIGPWWARYVHGRD